MKKSTWLALIAAAILYTVPLVYSVTRWSAASSKNCHTVAGLARIERSFILRQERQNVSLVTHGITFGIPKDQLPALLKQSRESQAAFLRDLDSLAANSCV